MPDRDINNTEIYTIIGKCLIEAILNGSPLGNEFKLGELDEKNMSGDDEAGYIEFSFEVPVEIVCSEDADLSYDEINNSIIKKWILVNGKDMNKRLTALVTRYINSRGMSEDYSWDMRGLEKVSTGRSQEDFNVEIDNISKKVKFIMSIPSIVGTSNSK